MYPARKRSRKWDLTNNKVKRITAVISLVLICVLLCACGQSAGDVSASPTAALTPTPEPVPVPTEEPTPEPTPDSRVLDESWFDDAVFIGDSVTASLETYAEQYGGVGDSLFLCRPSYSLRSAVSNEMKLQYAGTYYSIEDAIAQTGQKKVIMMLGGNDFGLLTERIKGTMEYWNIVYDKIAQVNPDAEIFIESVLPMHKQSETETFNNELIDELNSLVKDFCSEKGAVYIDLNGYFKGDDNTLKEEYSLDHQIHINEAGIQLWIEQLKNVDNYSEDPREA